MLINAALVGSGGFIGAVLRHGLSSIVQRSAPITEFPYGTLAVNLFGCLLIGIAAGVIDARQIGSPELRSFVMIGVLGGFTTFSAVGLDTLVLLRDADYLRAVGNIAIHIVVGLALVWIGFSLASGPR